MCLVSIKTYFSFILIPILILNDSVILITMISASPTGRQCHGYSYLYIDQSSSCCLNIKMNYYVFRSVILVKIVLHVQSFHIMFLDNVILFYVK